EIASPNNCTLSKLPPGGALGPGTPGSRIESPAVEGSRARRAGVTNKIRKAELFYLIQSRKSKAKRNQRKKNEKIIKNKQKGAPKAP
ncbi:MAG: hypothetical protein IJ497_13795, partial [Clostridia bacterium]|nr:hypothetical protein [Clostridia bacterium]